MARSEDRALQQAPQPQVPHQQQPPPAPVQATESQDAGVQRVGVILAAATTARWPMYLRNVKQILRAADGGFDERRYGFGGLMDLLKACQRGGLVRIERDRRGGLRVFEGPALAGTAAARPSHVNLPQPDVENEINEAMPMEMQVGEPVAIIVDDERDESSIDSSEPIPIDTTAELLGRAKPRKPRVRAARPAAAALGARSTTRAAQSKAVKKPAVKRIARPRKTSSNA
jgi:hypothetical protein